MEDKELINEIIEIVHRVSGNEKFSFRSDKRNAIVKIRNKIVEFSNGNKPLETIVVYLNGFIEGLCH